MSPDQRKFFYFPAWNACAKKLGWVMARGRLVADLDAQCAERIPSPAYDERFKVIELAEGFARQQHRAVIADDLRHACNHVASAGKTTHTEDMENHATTMAVRLFILLADPDDLNAVMIWLDPAEADRRDYADWLGRTANEAALIAIAKNTWGTSDWRGQGMDQLRWLAREARAGQDRRRRAFAHSAEIEPF